MSKAEEVERVWVAKTATGSLLGGKAPELDKSRLFRVRFKREVHETLPRMWEQPFGIILLLEAHQEIIGKMNHDHLAL